ncbi:hypothetical protein LVW35_02185 [Pseudomonas sp. HN11]|uniref:hypothetical protein n=1 Tax=Pseudomonas sp. HN11 TaxID=1344094 RepID=UPI001F411759|nr:hypothetical protein [Pseudomonas sp. HN11]UII72010.1 hypothetical protein LVW35_02185 [Pseudomonas sp. HN11]
MTTQSNQSTPKVTFQTSPNVATQEQYYLNAKVGEVYQSASPVAEPALIISKKWTHTAAGDVLIELGLQAL